MTLDPTAREANLRDSIKKYLIDSLYTTEGIAVTFDRWMAAPPISKSKTTVRWVSVNFGTMQRDTLTMAQILVYCCTRNDSEGFRLAQLTDTVMGYLTETDAAMRTIDFYRSRSVGAWTKIGGILVTHPIDETPQSETEDGTKFKLLTVRCKFASKV